MKQEERAIRETMQDMVAKWLSTYYSNLLYTRWNSPNTIEMEIFFEEDTDEENFNKQICAILPAICQFEMSYHCSHPIMCIKFNN